MQMPAKNWGGRQDLSGQGQLGADHSGMEQPVIEQAGQKKQGQSGTIFDRSGQIAGRRQVLRAILAGAACAAVAPPLLALPGDAHAVPGMGAGQTGKAWPLRRQTQLFMGTMVSITVAGVDNSFADEAMSRAFAHGRQLEAVYSRFDSSSPVSQLNRQGKLNDAPPALVNLLVGAERVSRATAGLFDVTVLPLLGTDLSKLPGTTGENKILGARRQDLANGGIAAWTADLSIGFRTDHDKPALERELKDVSELVGYQDLSCKGNSVSLAKTGMGITLDGIAKGHVANVMSALLVSLGCPDHLVNAGGDIVSAGMRGPGQPWRVGVADPLAPSRHLATLDLPNRAALATSGIGLTSPTGRHIVRPQRAHSANMDPDFVNQGQPDLASLPASATVLARDGLTADALATALCLIPTNSCLTMIEAMPGCACCLVNRDGGVVRSSRWPGRGETLG